MKTPVEWLFEQLWDTPKDKFEWHLLKERALKMEKEQMDKACGDWWNEGASYMYDGKRKYESFEQYYTETYEK